MERNRIRHSGRIQRDDTDRETETEKDQEKQRKNFLIKLKYRVDRIKRWCYSQDTKRETQLKNGGRNNDEEL